MTDARPLDPPCPICAAEHLDVTLCDHTEGEQFDWLATHPAPLPEGGYDASDPAHITKAAKRSKRKETREAEAFRWAMGHPLGRTLIYTLLEKCHAFGSPWLRAQATPPGTLDPAMVIAFALGEQNIGLYLRLAVAAQGEEFALLLKENGGFQ